MRLTAFSPYNIANIVVLQDPESQFIMPEGASQRRGRFELAFSQIGGSVCLGQSLFIHLYILWSLVVIVMGRNEIHKFYNEDRCIHKCSETRESLIKARLK